MTTDQFTSKIDEEMISRSAEVILLTDSSKFNRTSFVSYARLEDIDIIITDTGLENNLRRDYENIGIRIITAEIDQ